jgi:hypothetical protein
MYSFNIRAPSTKRVDARKLSGISNNYESTVLDPGNYYRNRKF